MATRRPAISTDFRFVHDMEDPLLTPQLVTTTARSAMAVEVRNRAENPRTPPALQLTWQSWHRSLGRIAEGHAEPQRGNGLAQL
jgi:hypothetical protein